MSAIACPEVYSILDLQRLLPSTTQLIFLCLRNIPDTGYISRGDGCLSLCLDWPRITFFWTPIPSTSHSTSANLFYLPHSH